MIRFKQFLVETNWYQHNKERNRRIEFVLNYLKKGKPKILARATKGGKTVLTLDDLHLGRNAHGNPYYYNVYIKHDMKDQPVIQGIWMDVWEPYMKVSEEEYYNLPLKERAMIETKNQLNKWFDFTFGRAYAEIYKK